MSAPSRVGRWGGRPWLAASLRLAAQAIPIALSVGVVYAASSLVPAPAGSPGPLIAWWAVLSALATLPLPAPLPSLPEAPPLPLVGGWRAAVSRP